jgi:GNAT superfamily N-acetyltransferase
MTDPRIGRVLGAAGADATDVRASAGPTPAFTALVGDDDRVTEMASTDLVQRYVTVHAPDGATTGGGLATVDGTAVGVFAMRTVEAARRRGVATRVLGELLAIARREGAETVWLQVTPDNLGARALYEGLGMDVVHHYVYRASPPGPG